MLNFDFFPVYFSPQFVFALRMELRLIYFKLERITRLFELQPKIVIFFRFTIF